MAMKAQENERMESKRQMNKEAIQFLNHQSVTKGIGQPELVGAKHMERPLSFRGRK